MSSLNVKKRCNEMMVRKRKLEKGKKEKERNEN
jgi:hypothetical protein